MYIAGYSQLGQGGLEEGVRVVAVDHLGFALLGFRGGGHRDGGRCRVWRLPLGQQLPLSLYVLPLLVDALLLPAQRRGCRGLGNGSCEENALADNKQPLAMFLLLAVK